jgi:hypothetical protein
MDSEGYRFQTSRALDENGNRTDTPLVGPEQSSILAAEAQGRLFEGGAPCVVAAFNQNGEDEGISIRLSCSRRQLAVLIDSLMNRDQELAHYLLTQKLAGMMSEIDGMFGA